MSRRLAYLLVAVGGAACGSPQPPIDPSNTSVFERLLEPSCTFSTCHNAPVVAASLDLTKDKFCAELREPSCLFPDRMRVVPGDPDNSFLMAKITGIGLSDVPTSGCSGTTNDRMPQGGANVSAADVALVRNWIAEGAMCEGGEPGDGGVDVPDGMDEAALVSVTVDRATPLAGEVVTFTVTLERLTRADPQIVMLDVASSVLSVPAQVFVPPFRSSVTFDGFTLRPSPPVKLTATSGGVSKDVELRVGGLQVTEVLNDVTGADDGLEWIKLRNTTTTAIDLSAYRLKVGQTSYDFTTTALTGTLAAGACAVIGGPTSSAANGQPVFTQPFNFNPDLPDGGAQAKGYAVFDDRPLVPAANTIPVDTMVVGQTNANLLGPDGQVAEPYCPDVAVDQSAQRTGAILCTSSAPQPSQCQ